MDKENLIQRFYEQLEWNGGKPVGTYNTDMIPPLCYGYCIHMTPKLDDEGLNVYRIHQGPIWKIISVHESGRKILFLGDTDDFLALRPNSEIKGYYQDLPIGQFRLSYKPEGLITATVIGSREIPWELSAPSTMRIDP